jgi:hypothetical protein
MAKGLGISLTLFYLVFENHVCGRGQSLKALPEIDTPWSIGVMEYWSVDPW